MKVAMMGSGGIGGYFGARLAEGGSDVAFIARGSHLAAMREHGLKIESPLGDIHLENIKATDDPASLGPVDLVIVGVKLWDIEDAAHAIAPLMSPGTAVVSFQNGVQKDAILRRVLGDDRVIGGVSYIAASIARPGVIAHTSPMARLVFGEFNGKPSSRTQTLLDACLKGGIDAEISPDISRATWEKFVFIVALSGTTTAIRSSIGPIRDNPQARSLLLDVMREAASVGRAKGVTLADDFPENRLAFIDSLPAGMTSSMHGDLDRGNRLESPWLSGGVVELGKTVGVPTPANRAIADILALYANGRPGG